MTAIICGKAIQDTCPDHPEALSNFDLSVTVKTRTIPINFNALKFFLADDFHDQRPVPGNPDAICGAPSAKQVLQYLCGDASSKIEKITKQYRDSTSAILQILPNLEFFNKRIIEPLREAQTSFMIGNWLATVALCGITCEMLTNLMFEIVKPDLKINGCALKDDAVQKCVLGMKFLDLPAEGRLNFLNGIGIISDETHAKLKEVKDIRNNYIHYYDYNPSAITQQEQALSLLKITTEIANRMILQDMKEGALVLKQHMEKYLVRKGVITDN